MKKTFKKLPIGIDDFKLLRTNDYCYVDKSLFIKELIDAGQGKVMLIPRPRRFGKTLNLSMLRYFFERYEGSESNRDLFDGLAITQHADCMEQQSKYPVIFLTFKDVKEKGWDSCYDKLTRVISAEFERHAYVLHDSVLSDQQQEDFKKIINRTASQALYENALKDLSFYLAKHYGVNPVILIDEYDSPIHAGFLENYYDDVVSFMRGLMCAGLKGNANLAYGVITGILRIAKESIFSGMNNLEVHTLLSPFYADKFGLLEDEVAALLHEYDINQGVEQARSWYNGYAAGGIPLTARAKEPYTVKLYNPWSIINFVKNSGTLGPYWANTSDNRLIQDLIRCASEDVKRDFELLLIGKSVTKKICEDVVFPSIYNDSNALWSFLLFTGYLTWQSRELMQVKCDAALVVPNREVLDCLKTLVMQWFTQSVGSSAYQNMLEAIRQSNLSAFERYFQQSVLDHMSFFDVTGKNPERVYHAYVLGLLVGLDATHEVKSNRESGFGRYDVCIIPRDHFNPGFIIEFKVFSKRDKTLEAAAQLALEQIEGHKYDTELRARGIQHIIKLAIVFDKKDVLIVEG